MTSFDARKFANPGLTQVKPFQPSKAIESLQRDYGLQRVIKLASNENPFGASKQVLESLRQHLPEINRYPDTSCHQLKHKLAKHFLVTAEQLAITNGSNELISLIAHAFLDCKSEAIYSKHSFVMYPIVTEFCGATGIAIDTKNWQIDLDSILSAITKKTRVIFLTNPNNPTGRYYSKNEFINFIKQVPKHIILVVDEAYHEYAEQYADYQSATAFLKNHPNLIITRTFSKVYGLAGLRVGFGIAHPSTADILNRLCPTYNVNSLGQLAAIAALDDQEHVQNSLTKNQHGLKQLAQGLSELELEFIPSICNFISVNLKMPTNTIYQRLLEQGIITRPCDIFGMKNYLRISVGTEEENKSLLNNLAKLITN